MSLFYTKTSQKNMETPLPAVKDLIHDVMKEMGVDSDNNSVQKDFSHLLEYLPKYQEPLPNRSMKDSFTQGLIPLSTDKHLQNKYVTFLGTVRVGQILEDMDVFAVVVANKHIFNPYIPKGSPYAIVTALVDQINFTDFVPKPQEDIKVSGHVSWAGKSSLEVVVWVDQKNNGIWHKITGASFLLAARDPIKRKPAVVNPIEPTNDKEKEILVAGEARKLQRIKAQQKHVTKVVPNDEEQKIIHDLYLRTTNTNENSLRQKILPPRCAWMSDWTLSNVAFSHPEDINLYSTVSGGFIMRHAEQLSWVLGYMFSKHRPILKSIIEINFQRAIFVSSIIQFHTHLVFTEKNFMQITVYVETYNPLTGESNTTNTLHFTYEVPELNSECIPSGYHEAMMYIDGRRHFLEVMKISRPTLNKL